MNATRTRVMAAALAAALAFLPVADASARGGFRGGGFRAAPSLRSFGTQRSIGTSRSLFGWGSATRPSLKASPFAASPSTPRFGGISGSRASVSKQRGLYESARRGNTLFSSKTEAAQSFKSRYAKDYASTFASEPAARPSYIPASTNIGGRSVNIVYNQGLGGYGYFHPGLGTWMLFDALSDAATLDYAMSNRGYYWGGAPVYVSHRPSFLGFAFAMLVLFIVGSAIARAVSRRRGGGGY
jgi:hypothetical protein